MSADPISASIVASVFGSIARSLFGGRRPDRPIDTTLPGPSILPRDERGYDLTLSMAPGFQGPIPQPAPAPTPPSSPPPSSPPPTTAPPAPQRPPIPLPPGNPDAGAGWARILEFLLRKGPAIRWGVGAIFSPTVLGDDIDILRDRQRADEAAKKRQPVPRVVFSPGDLPEVIVQPARRTRRRPKVDAPPFVAPEISVEPIRVPVPEVPAPSPQPRVPPAPATRSPPLEFPWLPFNPGTRRPPQRFRTPPGTSLTPTVGTPPGLTPFDTPDVLSQPFAPPAQPPTRTDNCQCSPERPQRRKRACTNPVLSRTRSEKDGKVIETTRREIKCQSSRKSSASRRAQRWTTSFPGLPLSF